MDHYIINNKKLIQKYEDLYKEKLCFENIKEKILHGYFDDINIESLSRFRIFLDTCLFLFNNEKIHHHKEIINGIEVEKGFRDTVAYYSKEFNKNHKFDNYINFIKNEFLELSSIDIDKPFIPINEIAKKLTLREQLEVIRNAFAHMQHGNYIVSLNGKISIYSLYNKDNTIKNYKIPQLIVLEPIFHDYIKKFYSNNINIGIVYKDSFLSNYSNEEKILKDYLIFYKISTSKDTKIFKSKEKMKKIILLKEEAESFFCFLKKNEKDYHIDEKNILQKFEKFFLKNKIKKIDEKFYNIKFLLDFQTELSNFLFHFIELNDFIIEYKLEDDGLEKVNNINIEGFKIKEFKELIKYIIKPKRAKKAYILERFRNSLAHGNIEVEFDLKEELQFIFKDIHKRKIKTIKIKAEDLERFLSQENFFENIKPKFKIL